MPSRSGQYLPQPSGYKAFIPTNLPPKLKITAKIEEQISQAEQALAQLNGVGFLLPNPDLFISMAIRKEALLSSQIEGTQATMTDILTYEKWEEVDNFDDVEEVVNYIKALKEGMEMLKTLPLGNRILKKTHQILLQGQRGKEKLPGEFRTSQNWIGPSLKQAYFVPSPFEVAHEAMGALEKFINQENQLHPLIECALIHYQFETIHPFLDGNGRIGRLLIDLYLHLKGVVEKPLLYMSLFFKERRQEYFDRLMLVRTKGDYEQWISFFLEAVIWSSKHAITKIKEITNLQSELRETILHEKKASIRSVELLDHLFISPLVSVKDIAAKLEVTYQGAKDQIALFVKLKILNELTGQKRGKRYAFSSYLELIEE